ncbi:prolactin-like [Hypomesus transpacificus]|uniref:prolactin-like n=1 Tax=Hypomesus transpacificus TaxID=137520 RepID=UPI001F071B69|nr:prolactin-like [Hypomesus transpacificus]
MTPVWFAILAIVCSEVPLRAGSAPVCAQNGAVCHSLPLADLLDRVIQQSARVQGISNDLHSEFEQHFPPSRNQIRRQKCHTYKILTPDGKENAQRLAREELTEVILRLLGAWGVPLTQLHHRMAQQEQKNDFNPLSSNKAQEMSDMVEELRNGVERVAEKMRLLGVIGNTLRDLSSPDALVSSSSSFSKRSEFNVMDHQDLLYCFRRDSNKVQSYLRILKCTILTEQNC